MSRLAVLLTVAAFWLAAYLVGGWWGVALVATFGFLGELLLFGVSHRVGKTSAKGWSRGVEQ